MGSTKSNGDSEGEERKCAIGRLEMNRVRPEENTNGGAGR